ncbi:hypothetical protein [Undibacterium sp. Ji49W]|uniref:hypothetical protein n=1 Tax=Undibacterium sp. Ji49W TaxID=3413040 RepID=UPI003BF06A71
MLTPGLVVAGDADQTLGAACDVTGAVAIQTNRVTDRRNQTVLVVALVTDMVVANPPITLTQRGTEMLLE